MPEIQSFVNAAFAPVMTGDELTLQAEYVPLARHRPGLAAQPSVIALPVPEPYARRYVTGRAIEQSLPAAVGAMVDWIINTEQLAGHRAERGCSGQGFGQAHLSALQAFRQLGV